MATLQRLEVWSDYQYAGGTRQSVIPKDAASRLITTTRVTRDDEGSIDLSKDAPGASALDVGMVVRFLFTDGSFDEWRVRQMTDTSLTERLISLLLQSPLQELQVGAAVVSSTINGVTSLAVDYKGLSPSSVLTAILAFCPAGWSAGTVTPTIPVSFSCSGFTPLRALRALVDAIKGQSVDCELDFRRNGTSGYFVDLVTSIGSGASAVDVRSGKNLFGTTRLKNRDRYAVEVVPMGSASPMTGAPSTIGRGYFEVTAKAVNVLTVQQPITGGAVLAYDNQVNGLYFVDDTNAKQLISASVAGATQQITVASGTNFTVGRWYRFAANAAGDELARLRKAESTAGPLAVVTSDLTDTTNFMTNPAMRLWTGASSAPPDGWTKFTAAHTLTKTTTAGLWLYGGQSCRCQTTVVAGSGNCLLTPTFSVYVPAWATSVTYSMWLYLAANTATPRVISMRGGINQNTDDLSALATGQWYQRTFTQSTAAFVGSVQSFQIWFSFGTAATGDVYVDSAAITFTAGAAPFVEGSSAARLWGLGNQYLKTYGSVPVAYSCDFANLAEWDAASFPYDAVSLGGTANVRDTDLNVTTSGRVLERTIDWQNPAASRLSITNRPPDLTTLLSGIA